VQLAAMLRIRPASPLTRGRRDVMRRAALQVCITNVQCAQQDWAWACPATRAASCSAADAVARSLQGPLGTAQSCVPLRMRSITTGVSHLCRADHSSGHQPPMLVRDADGCDDGSATRCTCSLALSSLADSDPKARSALRMRKEGKSIASTGNPGPNLRTCAFCPSV
jgi:hypothetical protein